MTFNEEIFDSFKKYNPLIFNLNKLKNSNINNFKNFDVIFSNNIAYPEFKLGFTYFIHQAKDKMEVLDSFANRKKIYLVTSLFEKNIDYKEFTDSGVKFTSIDIGITSFIKAINPNFPDLLNRAFLKLWEMIIMFDLIPDNDVFTSSHLAEGPGSFIQATILYRELQQKIKKIKSYSKDKYYGVTLYSDHDHLQMQQNFIKYFENEKNKRLYILETQNINKIKDLYGGGNDLSIDKTSITNGDLTKINTIRIFGGGKNKEAFAEPSDLITADGGFDWKKENLQEQEAYRLIFSEIVTALKIQKEGGNFVIKIFDTYTQITIKMIELLRTFYKDVYICKPYTSRISNSEKYVVCKNFLKSKINSTFINSLEDMIVKMNKNSTFNIIDIFSDFIIDDELIEEYKEINKELLIKQYVGINNISKFINLDNKNGSEYNEYNDKQIEASYFWNNLFLDSDNIDKINKIFSSFDFTKFKKEENKNENKEENKNENKKIDELNKSKIIKNNKNSRQTKIFKKINKNQKGGDYSDDIQNNLSESINSSDEIYGHIDSPIIFDNDFIDLSNIKII